MPKKKKELPKLTRKQQIFVDKYLETGNGTQSALEAYDTQDPGTAASIATENLKKLDIRQTFEIMAKDAQNVMYELTMSKKTPANVRATAAKDIMDRAGYKPVEKVEEKTTGELKITRDD